MNRSIEILFTYHHKIDYYELYWNSSVLNFEARLDEIPTKQSKELSDDEDAEFICPYSVLDDRDYSIIVIESPSSTQDDPPEAYVYFINKETFEVTFQFYPSYYQRINMPLTTHQQYYTNNIV